MMLLCLLIEKLTTQSLLLVAVMDKLCTCVHPAEISQQLSCNMVLLAKVKCCIAAQICGLCTKLEKPISANALI